MKSDALRSIALVLLMAAARPPISAQGNAVAAPPAAGVVTRLGSIRSITESGLLLATDQGREVAVKLQPGAHLYRLAPGEMDLKGATPMQRTDLQVGDRVLVRGKVENDGVTMDASAVLAMKQQDIAQRRQEEMLDWQRRSICGLVQQIDLQAGTLTLSMGSAGGSKSVVVRATAKTKYKRYAPDSVKWEDAVTSRLEDIHVGDQLRAKGNKNEDGVKLEAEEVVAGTFRNIAGLVTAIDSVQATLTVQDLATKKQVTVKINGDSQMKKLPEEMAQWLALRWKGAPQQEETSPATAGTAAGAPRGEDLNQMLGRLPAATLGDLQKGEAVMIVSTVGSARQLPEAVSLLGGIEPILTVAPSGRGTESLLTPWSLASAPGGDQP